MQQKKSDSGGFSHPAYLQSILLQNNINNENQPRRTLHSIKFFFCPFKLFTAVHWHTFSTPFSWHEPATYAHSLLFCTYRSHFSRTQRAISLPFLFLFEVFFQNRVLYPPIHPLFHPGKTNGGCFFFFPLLVKKERRAWCFWHARAFFFLVTVVVVLMLAFLGLRWFNLLVFFSGGKGVVCL